MGAGARANALTASRAALAALMLGGASPAAAQGVQPELRVDVQGPRAYTVAPGAGLTVALGYYARVSAIVGATPRADARFIADHWRGDLLARFLLDPFRERRWGLSVGGGLSVRRHTYLAALVELEGPASGGWVPAVQLGVSGGIRAALILRRGRQGRR